jgi:hypothetical protein
MGFCGIVLSDTYETYIGIEGKVYFSNWKLILKNPYKFIVDINGNYVFEKYKENMLVFDMSKTRIDNDGYELSYYKTFTPNKYIQEEYLKYIKI